MSPIALAFAYLRDQPAAALLNVALAAFGVGAAIAVMLISAQLDQRIVRDGQGVDLVVGDKGSPLQLILSSVHHADVPIGNISMAEAQRLAEHPLVANAMPLALGDSYRGFRIVGATPDYVAHYGAEVAEGDMWRIPLEVVLGARVAADTGLQTGDMFMSSHGLAADAAIGHDHAPLVVSGVLKPTGTVLDRLIITSLDTVWIAHGETVGSSSRYHEHEEDDAAPHSSAQWALTKGDGDREITALLIQYASPIAAVRLPPLIEQQTSMMAAKPADQLQRLMALLGAGFDVLRGVGWVVLALAGFGVLVTLLSQMRERRADIALMRVMGASRARVVFQVVLEGVMVVAIGAVVGVALGHLGAHIFGQTVDQARAAGVSGAVFLTPELWIVLAAMLIGALGAMIPALLAYRVDLAETVKR